MWLPLHNSSLTFVYIAIIFEAPLNNLQCPAKIMASVCKKFNEKMRLSPKSEYESKSKNQFDKQHPTISTYLLDLFFAISQQ